jgi:hypothetical protein
MECVCGENLRVQFVLAIVLDQHYVSVVLGILQYEDVLPGLQNDAPWYFDRLVKGQCGFLVLVVGGGFRSHGYYAKNCRENSG